MIEWLKEDFEYYLNGGTENKVVLFFDPQDDFKDLIDHLKGDFTVLKASEKGEGLLGIKYKIEYSKPEENFVVYLPFSKDSKKISYLKEYEFTQKTFSDTLYMYLKKKGVEFPKDKKRIAKIKKGLPSLALESIGEGVEFWKSRFVKEEGEIFFPNFDEYILNFIADPKGIFKKLESENKLESFVNMVNKKYGFNGDLKDPVDFRLNFLTQICFIELYQLSGQPEDFPFRDLLPEEKYFSEAIKLVENLRNHGKYKEWYKSLSLEIEERYNLKKFAQGHSNPKIETFRAIEIAAIDKIKKQVKDVKTKKQFREIITENKNFIEEKNQGFWSEEDEVKTWGILQKICQLVDEIGIFHEEFSQVIDINDIVDKYCQKYYNIDSIYREYLNRSYEIDEDLEEFSPWIDKLYLEFLDKINSKYTGEILKQKNLKIEGVPYQGDFWKGLSLDAKTAIIFVDALRFELGRELEDRLSNDLKVKLSPMYTQIPTITAVGMSFLLSPKNPEVGCDPSGLEIKAEGYNLSKKEDRKKYLKYRHENIEFYNIVEFNKLSSKKIKEKKDPVVIFSQELDSLGESGGSNFLRLFSNGMADIVKAIRKLTANGYTKLYIVTDHGFLSFDDPESKYKVGDRPSFIKDAKRFACGEKLEGKNLVSLDVPYLKEKTLYFPRGIYYFKKDSFLHGGISIHESIIPSIYIESEEEVPEKFGIAIKMEGEIFNKIFEVRIKPTVDRFDRQPRTVEVMVYHNGKPISNKPAVMVGMEEESVMLRLSTTQALSKGDKVKVVAKDQETKEILNEVEKELVVEFDEIDI